MLGEIELVIGDRVLRFRKDEQHKAVAEALPETLPETERTRLALVANALQDRWAQAASLTARRIIERQRRVTLEKLQGAKARKGTRFYAPPQGFEHVVTKTLSVGDVWDDARWNAEFTDEFMILGASLYSEVATDVVAELEALYGPDAVAAAPPPAETPPEQPQPAPPPDGVSPAAVAAALGLLLALRGNRRLDDELVGRLAGAVARRAGLAALANDTTKGAVDEAITHAAGMGAAADQLLSMLDAVGAAFDRAMERAKTIGEWFSTGGINEATNEVAQKLPIRKYWLSRRDERVRPAHVNADGQIRDRGEPFDVAGWPMQFPGDPIAPIHLTINCRCVLVLLPPRGWRRPNRRRQDGRVPEDWPKSLEAKHGHPGQPGYELLHPGRHSVNIEVGDGGGARAAPLSDYWETEPDADVYHEWSMLGWQQVVSANDRHKMWGEVWPRYGGQGNSGYLAHEGIGYYYGLDTIIRMEAELSARGLPLPGRPALVMPDGSMLPANPGEPGRIPGEPYYDDDGELVEFSPDFYTRRTERKSLEHKHGHKGEPGYELLHPGPAAALPIGKVINGYYNDAIDYRAHADPDKRFTVLWQATYDGNGLVRKVIDNLVANRDPFAAIDLDPNGEWVASALDRGYHLDDLRIDVVSGARWVMDHLAAAEHSDAPLYRGLWFPQAEAHPFTEGQTFTIGPQSFSYLADTAAFYSARGRHGQKVMVVASPGAHAFTLDEWSQMEGSESVVAGTFRVTRIANEEHHFRLPGGATSTDEATYVYVEPVEAKHALVLEATSPEVAAAFDQPFRPIGSPFGAANEAKHGDPERDPVGYRLLHPSSPKVHHPGWIHADDTHAASPVAVGLVYGSGLTSREGDDRARAKQEVAARLAEVVGLDELWKLRDDWGSVAVKGNGAEWRPFDPATAEIGDAVRFRQYGWWTTGRFAGVPEADAELPLGRVSVTTSMDSYDLTVGGDELQTLGPSTVDPFDNPSEWAVIAGGNDRTGVLTVWLNPLASTDVTEDHYIGTLDSDEGRRIIAQHIARDFVATWAGTANDRDPAALAIQEIAAQEFGMPEEGVGAPYRWTLGSGPADQGVDTSRREIIEASGPTIAKVLRAMYDETQRQFAEAGIKEVVLYRGFSWDSAHPRPPWAEPDSKRSYGPGTRIGSVREGDTGTVVGLRDDGTYELDLDNEYGVAVFARLEGSALVRTAPGGWTVTYQPTTRAELPLRPLSSWAYKPDTATDFAYGGGTIVRAVVPIDRVLSTPRSGFGALPEDEFVVLATPGEVEVLPSVTPPRANAAKKMAALKAKKKPNV